MDRSEGSIMEINYKKCENDLIIGITRTQQNNMENGNISDNIKSSRNLRFGRQPGFITCG
jgi:hypothetical protein